MLKPVVDPARIQIRAYQARALAAILEQSCGKVRGKLAAILRRAAVPSAVAVGRFSEKSARRRNDGNRRRTGEISTLVDAHPDVQLPNGPSGR
ncbi:hypothetical protein HN011_006155 [Eciton burchellii]|nr:hypothetical protein HN011_006155 [Eciton burchellii]